MSEQEQFGRYVICQASDRSPITFPRVPEEVVCLGFDPDTEGFAELHVLSAGEGFPEAQRISFKERAWSASALRGPCFGQILDVQEHDGMLFYATALNDGEFLSDYLLRNGPMDRAVALALSLDLIEAIIQLQPYYRLLMGLRLNNLMVVMTEASFLALRIVDLGLARPEARQTNDFELEDLISEVAKVLFYMLMGKPWIAGAGGQLERLSGIAVELRMILRKTLEGDGASEFSLEQFHAELKRSLAAVSPRRSGPLAAGPLAVARKSYPRFSLKKQLFPGLDIEELVSDRYELITDRHQGVYSSFAFETAKNREVFIQILPPSAALPLNASSQVAMEMSKMSREDFSLLVKPLGFHEEERVAFIFEEAINGFSLPQLLTARNHDLEPNECLILLRRIGEAFDAAKSAEILLKNPTIHSILVEFPDEPERRIADLRIRRVDHWPNHRIKLRCHPTMRSLISPPPSGRMESNRSIDEQSDESARTGKAFISIAEMLLLGPWPPPPWGAGTPERESKQRLRQFFKDYYQRILKDQADFTREDFLQELANEPELNRHNDDNESMGTIIDGRLETSDVKSESPKFKSELEVPSDGATESLGTIDDEEYDLPTESSAPSTRKKKRFPWRLGMAILSGTGIIPAIFPSSLLFI